MILDPPVTIVPSNSVTFFKFFNKAEHGVFIRDMYVHVAWVDRGQEWTFITTHKRFVRWVRHGCKVECGTCRGYNRQCEHVIFAGDFVKTHRVVKAIQMGLV